MADDRQKKLKKFLDRRHPRYEEMAGHWTFCYSTYEGGRQWFLENLHKYIKEGDQEFAERLQRAYRFNHTREVVDLVDKYIFKMEISRNEDDAPESVKMFWEAATRTKQEIDDLMKSVSKLSSIFGRVWIVVDSNVTGDVLTKADEKKIGARTYAYVVTPLQVLDVAYDDMGELLWILIYEQERDDKDPINSTGAVSGRYRLWTRDYSQLFRIKKGPTGAKLVIEDLPIPHNLGVVPVIPCDNVLSDDPYCSPAMIADVAYLDRAVANYLSNLDAIIQDQTFSQLAIPAQGLTPGDDTHKKIMELGTKRIFTYDGEGGAAPFFLSPDVKQAELILAVVVKVINEIYHSVGLAGERTKEDNGKGIDNSSGVAKAYDFERVNSLLTNKADSLEVVENKLVWMVAKRSGEEAAVEALDEELVDYPDDFDVRGLYDEFEIGARLALLEAPDEVRREQMRRIVDKLFENIGKELKDKMEAEIKSDWPPKIDPLAAPGSTGGVSAIRKNGTNSTSNQMVNG